MKKAIIFDLDNTIYPVHAIGHKLFDELYRVIEHSGDYQGQMEDIKDAMQRKPFQVVAENFKFGDALINEGLRMLSQLTYTDEIKPFDDYLLTKEIDCLKFLVTTGFTKLQESKIKQLKLQDDFEAYFIVDPSRLAQTKKDVFQNIALQYKLNPEDILVVGDDIHSEIQAGRDLGIDTVVYDPYHTNIGLDGYHVISHYDQLDAFLSK